LALACLLRNLAGIDLRNQSEFPEAADLVVTDPVLAGVMAVMAVADTAKFNIARLKTKIF